MVVISRDPDAAQLDASGVKVSLEVTVKPSARLQASQGSTEAEGSISKHLPRAVVRPQKIPLQAHSHGPLGRAASQPGSWLAQGHRS